MENLLTEPVVSIHPDAHVGLVTLRVFNLDCALKFYEEIPGFQHRDHVCTRAKNSI